MFSVVNPWGASAWQFLELLQKRWLKNVVFVLQQADLREATEVEAVTQHLRQTAMQRFGQAFPIFAVSAKKALHVQDERRGQGAAVDGEQFRRRWKTFINEHVSSGETREREAQERLPDGAGGPARAFRAGAGSERIIAADREQLAHLRETVAQMQKRSGLQVEGFLRGVDTAYDRVQQQGEHLLKEQLKIWQSIKLVFGRNAAWQHDFQRNIEEMLRTAIAKQMEHALSLLENELKSVWSQLHDSLHNHFNSEARKSFGEPMSDFAEQRTRLLQKIDMVMVERHGRRFHRKAVARVVSGIGDEAALFRWGPRSPAASRRRLPRNWRLSWFSISRASWR